MYVTKGLRPFHKLACQKDLENGRSGTWLHWRFLLVIRAKPYLRQIQKLLRPGGGGLGMVKTRKQTRTLIIIVMMGTPNNQYHRDGAFTVRSLLVPALLSPLVCSVTSHDTSITFFSSNGPLNSICPPPTLVKLALKILPVL